MITLNWKRATGYFFLAYLVVTILATATSEIYGYKNQSPPPAPGQSILESEAFVATVPYHVLIMLLVWPLFAALYFDRPRLSRDQERRETLHLSVYWVALAIVTDYIGFVLIRHPYSLTPYEFYVVYQPWISLIYGAIFMAPWMRLVVKNVSR